MRKRSLKSRNSCVQRKVPHLLTHFDIVLTQKPNNFDEIIKNTAAGKNASDLDKNIPTQTRFDELPIAEKDIGKRLAILNSLKQAKKLAANS